jgi:hypothetical protein
MGYFPATKHDTRTNRSDQQKYIVFLCIFLYSYCLVPPRAHAELGHGSTLTPAAHPTRSFADRYSLDSP